MTQQQQAPAAAPKLRDAQGNELSLLEMTRVMDVARTLRRERSVADEQLNLAETKALLRAKLLEAAKVAGDPVTEAEVDAAIELYYDNLHEFQPPEAGLQTTLASVYVRRKSILGWTAAVAAAAILAWSLWFAGVLPGGPRTAAQAESLYREVVAATQTIETTAQQPRVKSAAAQAAEQAEVFRDQANLAELAALRDQLQSQAAVLASEYRLVLGGDQQTGIYRVYDDRDISGYYLIVQAIDANGNPRPMKIRNAETGKIETVSVWAEQVPQEVYDRIAADKQADGIVDARDFGQKTKGQMDETVTIQDSSGSPIARGRQITQW